MGRQYMRGGSGLANRRGNISEYITGLIVLILIFYPNICHSFLISTQNSPQPQSPPTIPNPLPHSPTFPQNCTESYPRLFYTSTPTKMLIKFNTISPCTRSYVTITQDTSISKYYCTSSMLRIQQKTVFVRYVQSCGVDIRGDFGEFWYMVYGQGQDQEEMGSEKWKGKAASDLYRVNIPQAGANFNMIVTADWGPMLTRTYQPIYPSLVRQIHQKQRPIHALLLIGDVAYNLDSKQCQQYELFMTELSVVSPYIPIIPIYGNHQTFTPTNAQIFKQSFQSYNLSTDIRVQSYKFWNLKLITFDPYLQIYQKSSPENYKKLRENLLKQLSPSTDHNQLTILSSHYPVICSQDVFHCRQTLLTLGELYGEVSLLGEVDLYLGAHMHEYQRIVPYKNGSFLQRRVGPYGKGEMPSIVQGVAGCDVGIIDQQYPVQYFSVTHTYNKTGYGVLTVSNISNNPKAEYIHYMTPSATQTLIFDRVIIDPSLPKNSNQNLNSNLNSRSGQGMMLREE